MSQRSQFTTGSRWTTLYPIATDDEGLQTVVLGLDFRLREDHFRHGVVSLKCKAELFDIYYSGREVKVHRRSLAQRSSPLGGWSAGGVWRPTLLPVALASGLACIFARTTMAAT
ncbi:hypothetical protein FJT64_027582 [Amphibalanus amphitrite]|uniref:Uncharacterized protein n=1 Tax=Amphibalanus amphitrite TaxID=1232801 RepID=A0A6A4VY22_AMPAM|nr:hypothetical protein FJT64_027582 [Amphibalanus amphitrite]